MKPPTLFEGARFESSWNQKASFVMNYRIILSLKFIGTLGALIF